MENKAMMVPRDGGFEVHIDLGELIWNAPHLKNLVNMSLSGTGIHACMYRYGNVVHFGASSFTQWQKKTAETVLKKINASCYADYAVDTQKKRMRQVRDALNKCSNPNKIERVAEILGA